MFYDYAPRVYSMARKMVANECDAEDVTQDVLLQVILKLPSFRGESAFGTWLHRVGVNVILNRRSERSRFRQRFLEEPAAGLDAPARSTSPAVGLDFETAIARLPAGARRIFVLHDVEGYRHEEIAGLLGISAGTSKSQLHYARMALRRTLG